MMADIVLHYSRPHDGALFLLCNQMHMNNEIFFIKSVKLKLTLQSK